jgi:glycosyltransferase involved in cell wall biosynthesis
LNDPAPRPPIRVSVVDLHHDLIEAQFLPLQRAGIEVDEADHGLSVGSLPHGTQGILHLNWPTEAIAQGGSRARACYRLARFLTKVVVRRSQGWKVVWTVHNEQNHLGEHVGTERLAQALLARYLADRVVALSEVSRRRVVARWGRRCEARLRVVPPATAENVYGPALARSVARSLLGVPHRTRLLVVAGQLRAHKGIAELADAIRSLDGPLDPYTLVLVGPPGDEGTVQTARDLAGELGHVRLELRRQEREDLRRWMSAADWLVLPYQRTLNSGVALLGLTYGVPMIVPRLGSLPEILDGNDACNLFFEPAEAGALAGVLREAISMPEADRERRRARVLRMAERYRPDVVSDRLLGVYTELTNGSPARQRADGVAPAGTRTTARPRS